MKSSPLHGAPSLVTSRCPRTRVEAVRDASGAFNWLQFLQQPVVAPSGVGSAAPDRLRPRLHPPRRPAVTLRHASVRDGTVNITDDSAGRFRCSSST